MMGQVSRECVDGGIVPSMATQPQAEAPPPLAAPVPESVPPAWRETAGWAGGAPCEPWDYVPKPPFVLDDDGYLISDSMGQNERHYGRLAESWTVLRRPFRGRGGAVCGDLSMPYVKGQPHKVVIPDLLVALAAEASGGRDSYKLWQEPVPDFVLEDLSPSSGRRDLVDKRALYQRLGVPEYWMFDETGTRLRDDAGAPLGTLLVGYRLRGGEYKRLRANAAGCLPSEALGLELCVREGVLRFFDPVAGEFLRNLDEAEQRAEAERRRADDAERRVAELEAELRGRADSD